MRKGVASIALMCFAALIISMTACTAWELEKGKVEELTPAMDLDSDTHPHLIVHDGSLFAFWESKPNGSASGLKYSEMGADGTWVSAQYMVPGASGEDRDISTASHNGTLYAAWVTDDAQSTKGGDWDLVLSWHNATSGDWHDPIEISSPQNTGADFSPSLISANGKLFVVWQTNDTTDSKGSDFDIVLAEMQFNGTNITITPPYEITKGHDGSDMQPAAISVGSDIWVAWASNDASTDGVDYDVLVRTYDTTLEQLGPKHELSPAGGTEDSINPTICELDGTVYVAWQTSEKGLTRGEDLDIVLSNYTDGAWTGPWEITPSHDTKSDAFPELAAFNGSMFILWESNDNTTTSGDDWDIVLVNLLPEPTTPLEITPEKDNYDESGVTTRGYSALAFDGKLFICWSTQNPTFTNGTDRDIVYTTVSISEKSTGGDPIGGDDTVPGDDDKGMVVVGIAAVIIVAIVAIVAYYHTKM